MTAPIICGVNESRSARVAAFRAAELAVALDAPLHLVTGIPRMGPIKVSGIGPIDWRADALSVAEHHLDALIQELPVATATKAVLTYDPATALCHEATRLDAQLIVVGNYRVQGLSRVLGSVATAVTRHAPCDVDIVQTRGS
jgi:nucleotide-binding universal stress UspA family protein